MTMHADTTDTMPPGETLAAIAAHRQTADQRRTELLAERRRLSVQALTGSPTITAKVTNVASELRAIEVTLEDLQATEQQARAALVEQERERDQKLKAATIKTACQLLDMRDALAVKVDATVIALLQDLAQFDFYTVEAHNLACKYGRPDALMFFKPQSANLMLFDRLTALGSLSPHLVDGHVGTRATIADVSRFYSERVRGHLAERLLPPRPPVLEE